MSRVLKPINHVRLSGSVIEALEMAIVQGELVPGTQLVDRQLAEALHVSRTPVREALRQMEASGLVRRHTRGGVTGWRVAEITEQDVRELFALRRLLEPVGFAWLKSHWDPEVALKLATYFDEFGAEFGPEHYEAYIQRDRQFHKELVALAHNSRIIYIYQIMERQIDRIRRFLSTGYEGRMSQIISEHGALCEAIGAGELDLAMQQLTYHLQCGEDAMIRFGHERNLLTTTFQRSEQ